MCCATCQVRPVHPTSSLQPRRLPSRCHTVGIKTTVGATLVPTDATGTHFYAADQVGTTQLEFNPAGIPVWRGEFTPFGQELSNNQPTQNRYKFTGKERDPESGLDYFGARFYNSNLGRWMSADWAAKTEPVPYAKLGDPQTFRTIQ